MFSIRRNEEIRLHVPIIRDASYTETINYAVSGLPPGMTYSFSPPSSVGARSDNLYTVLTIAASLSTTLGNYSLAVYGYPKAPRNTGAFDVSVEHEYVETYWQYSVMEGEYPGPQFSYSVEDMSATTSPPTTPPPTTMATTTVRPEASLGVIGGQTFNLPGNYYSIPFTVNINGWDENSLTFFSSFDPSGFLSGSISRPNGGYALIVQNPSGASGNFNALLRMTNTVSGNVQTDTFPIQINAAPTTVPPTTTARPVSRSSVNSAYLAQYSFTYVAAVPPRQGEPGEPGYYGALLSYQNQPSVAFAGQGSDNYQRAYADFSIPGVQPGAVLQDLRIDFVSDANLSELYSFTAEIVSLSRGTVYNQSQVSPYGIEDTPDFPVTSLSRGQINGYGFYFPPSTPFGPNMSVRISNYLGKTLTVQNITMTAAWI